MNAMKIPHFAHQEEHAAILWRDLNVFVKEDTKWTQQAESVLVISLVWSDSEGLIDTLITIIIRERNLWLL